MPRNNPADLPIVFLHLGYSDYLELSLRQAKKSNPNAPIYLLGDEANKTSLVNHGLMSQYGGQEVLAFEKAYQHLSDNPEHIEKLCFTRWIIIKNFLLAHGYQDAFIVDTDVLLYTDIAANFGQFFRAYDASLILHDNQSPYRWSYSGGQSYWKTDVLIQFCAYLQDFYQTEQERLQEKWQYTLDNQLNGGICDMTALYLFFTKNSYHIHNISSCIHERYIFDENIKSPYNADLAFEHSGKTKSVHIRQGKAYGYCKDLGRELEFALLHFQGNAKPFMRTFYTGPKFVDFKKIVRRLRYFKQRIHMRMGYLKSGLLNKLGA